MPSGIAAARILFNRTFLLLIAGLLSLMLLVVYAQAISAARILWSAPLLLRIPGLVLLASLATLVALATGRFVLLYCRLKKSPQIRLRDLETLDKHLHLRDHAIQRQQAAKQAIRLYLEQFDLAAEANRRTLRSVGFPDEQVRRLRNVRTSLLNSQSAPSSEQWLKSFQSEFQALLDQQAAVRIRVHAIRSGLAAASLPSGVLDTLATFASNLTMLRDLCVIYNVKVGHLGLLLLFAHVAVHVLLASKSQDAAESVGEEVANLAAEEVPSSLAHLAGFLSSKAAEAGINGMWTYRIGRVAISLLRPVSR